ncbi:MAG: hypothetical protein WC955_00255 [Elusimicrobiota bacterium]
MENLNALREMMKKMAEAEVKIGELYLHCARVWKEDKEFWISIAGEEAKHAANLEKMFQMIEHEPNKYKLKHEFKIESVDLIIKGISNTMENLKSGKMIRHSMYFVARNIESSLLEKNYVEIIETEVPEYNVMINDIIKQTVDHRKMLIAKIEKG